MNTLNALLQRHAMYTCATGTGSAKISYAICFCIVSHSAERCFYFYPGSFGISCQPSTEQFSLHPGNSIYMIAEVYLSVWLYPQDRFLDALRVVQVWVLCMHTNMYWWQCIIATTTACIIQEWNVICELFVSIFSIVVFNVDHKFKKNE